MPVADKPSLSVLTDVTCLGCGCACDDIEVNVADEQIVATNHTCELGKAWFADFAAADVPDCRIDGRPATLEAGLNRAVQILTSAKLPLVYGLSRVTSEAQRTAVAIADWIGATLDTPKSLARALTGVSFQGVGEVTCSLGEIANRGDFLVFWRANPVEQQPRHFERYSLERRGMFLPNGRRDRRAILIDSTHTATAAAMDEVLLIKPGSDFEALWTLRALLKGLSLDAAAVQHSTGVAHEVWQKLAEQMKHAKFGVVMYDDRLTATRNGHINADALLALVRDLNAHTRFVAKPMGGDGNAAGAEGVTLWQTGYPFAVDLSAGYPRFSPDEYSAQARLERGEADAALIVGDNPFAQLSPAAIKRLRQIPSVAFDYRNTETLQAATVAFVAKKYGVHTGGTIARMDEVPLPLRPSLNSPRPAIVDLLRTLETQIRSELASGGTK